MRVGCLIKRLCQFSKATLMAGRGTSVSFPSEHKAGPGCGILFGDPKVSPLGLLVVHEWWGVNDQIKDEAEEMARNGNFTVLVPDMYRGKVADDREEAGHLMTGLDWDGALKDISGAATFLISRGCKKVGVTGFCLGGALSLAAAVRCPEISAAAPFYGIPSSDVVDVANIKIPVQAHFAEKDDITNFSSPADYNPLRAKLIKAGVDLEFHTYDAGHAFTSIKHENYNKDICNQALSRVYEFMQKRLK